MACQIAPVQNPVLHRAGCRSSGQIHSREQFAEVVRSMKKLVAVVLACATATTLHAQFVPPEVAAAQQNQSPETRSKALAQLFNDYWQDKLKHEPEYATYLGDKRYDAELTDYSPRAVNDELARERGFLERLSAISTEGLPHQQQLSAELLLRQLIEDQEAAPFKEWEMPVNQYDGLHLQLPQLPGHTAFDDANDYSNYIARLMKVPVAFSQIMANMQTGVD